MVNIDVSGAGASFSTSAGLAGLVSDETGTGALVLATSPTLVTPVLGAATATSLTGSGATVTASTPLLDLSQTWDNAGVTFHAISVSITNTASAASSSIINLRVGGSSVFDLRRSGLISTTSGIVLAASTSSEVAVGYYGAGVDMALNGYVAIGALFNPDTYMRRDSAGVFAMRHSTTAHALRLYYSYTDDSNYARLSLSAGASAMTIACETAGTGADNIDLALTPGGTGAVRFGTHSALAAETVTGYITIKDSGGTSRKLAVVS